MIQRACRSCRRLLLAAGGLTALLSGCGESGELALPPEDDVFVSYYQAAFGLASGLTRFRSAAEFEEQRPGVDRLTEQLADYRQQLDALPAPERERLAQQHEKLVKQAQAACEELEAFHARNPGIIGDQWDRYWQSLSFPEETDSPAGESRTDAPGPASGR